MPDNDSTGRGLSSPALRAIPFPRGQQRDRGTTGSGGTSLHAHPLSGLPDLGLAPVLQPSLTVMTRTWPVRRQDLISSQGLHTCSNWYRTSLRNCSSQALEEHLVFLLPLILPPSPPPAEIWNFTRCLTSLPSQGAVESVSGWPKIWSEKCPSLQNPGFYTVTWPILVRVKNTIKAQVPVSTCSSEFITQFCLLREGK